MRLRTLVLRYAAFAALATAANLGTQRAILQFGDTAPYFALAIGAGTLVGLGVKFALDKRWIFYDDEKSAVANARKFSLYSLAGILTTLVFWGTETAFWLIGRTDLMREVGALIGLTIGYVLKYNLDKRFVFARSERGTGVKLSGWGRYPMIAADVCEPRGNEDLRAILVSRPSVIARGNGRAYGDCAINPAGTISMRHFDRMLSFDADTGQLIAEAGVLLADVISAFIPRGWFPAVTPGTKFVTLGGMIAADVHGKNHHRDGSFRQCVDWIDLMDANGEIRRCSRDVDSHRFDLTLGGMGLTGVILRAAFRLRRVETAWIHQTTVPAANLAEVMQAFEHAENSTYSVAWIDCLGTGSNLGRSILILGEHATLSDLPPGKRSEPLAVPTKRTMALPVDLPSFILNRWTVRAFNEAYYRRYAGAKRRELVRWDTYFYPLDAILGWNRIYGRNGFVQFQCVIPLDRSEQGLFDLLTATSLAGAGSFLAVLKRLGPQDSPFSFPTAGYTLALDFPANSKTFELLETLDAITIRHGGRFYLAKDSRMSAATLHASDPRAAIFARTRSETGDAARFQSSQSERLSI